MYYRHPLSMRLILLQAFLLNFLVIDAILIFNLILFVINLTASISLKQDYRNNEKCNYQYISCDVDDCSPYRSILGGRSNERWIKTCNDKAWTATNLYGVYNLLARDIQHSDIAACESNKA